MQLEIVAKREDIYHTLYQRSIITGRYGVPKDGSGKPFLPGMMDAPKPLDSLISSEGNEHTER